MKDRFICALAALCLILAGCGSQNGTKEKVTLIVKVPVQEMNCVSNPEITSLQSFLEQAGAAFTSQYDKADVTIDLKVFATVNEVEAISGSFDTEDAADILFEAYFNMAGYIHTGRVVPLDDIITDEMQKDIDSSMWEMCRINGKTYAIPYLSMQNILIYNKSLFRACGLESYFGEGTQIQNWTIEEWNDILDTLAAKLPEGTYPMMMYAGSNQGDTHTMSRLRAFGSTIFDEDGNFDLETEEGIRALAWLQDGVARGWYPPRPENMVMKDCSELFSNQQLAIYNFNNANTTIYDKLENYGFVNYPGNIATAFLNAFEVFDNGDEAKLRIAKDFIRYIYENEEWLELSAGNLPVSRKVAEKYADQITMLKEFSQNSVNVIDFMNNSPNWQGNETSVRSVFWPHIQALLAGRTTPEECAAALDQDCNAALKQGRLSSTLHE